MTKQKAVPKRRLFPSRGWRDLHGSDVGTAYPAISRQMALATTPARTARAKRHKLKFIVSHLLSSKDRRRAKNSIAFSVWMCYTEHRLRFIVCRRVAPGGTTKRLPQGGFFVAIFQKLNIEAEKHSPFDGCFFYAIFEVGRKYLLTNCSKSVYNANRKGGGKRAREDYDNPY